MNVSVVKESRFQTSGWHVYLRLVAYHDNAAVNKYLILSLAIPQPNC